jgi:uncharacterized membrane protein YeiB
VAGVKEGDAFAWPGARQFPAIAGCAPDNAMVTKEFAVLMAQVLPVIMLALVVQAGTVAGRLRDNLSRAQAWQHEQSHDSPGRTAERLAAESAVDNAAIALVYQTTVHVIALVILGLAEIFCLMTVQTAAVPEAWVDDLVFIAAALGIVLLLYAPVIELWRGVRTHAWDTLTRRASGRRALKITVAALLGAVAISVASLYLTRWLSDLLDR